MGFAAGDVYTKMDGLSKYFKRIFTNRIAIKYGVTFNLAHSTHID